MVQCLEEQLKDSLSFYGFPEIDKKKISSTNRLERINIEPTQPSGRGLSIG